MWRTDRHYLLLEYITGQDLRQFIKQNGAQDQVKVLDWALKLADILVYLHGQNPPIIHRDLTPDNIVLKNDGEIVLIDFGAANEFLGTATGTLIGKQAYIAPEQLRGKANKASDLYSFGGTIYYLLTGKEPVPLSISHPKSANPDINEELDRLVSDLSAFEESERLADAVELKTRLTAIKEQLVDKAGVHG
ncbi:MAG: serine/threonine protein kinase [Candidatus Obscuribacter sp.]|nr:serine/threonine protein kinase [Candidatus Obscuribacter sp.]